MFTITPPNLRYRRLLAAVRMASPSVTASTQQHRYTLYDLQYIFLFAIFVFCYTLITTSAWIKIALSVFMIAPLFSQHTRAFMLPFLTIVAWLALFCACRFVPAGWRPHIFTSVLPTLDNILYGGNLSNLLANSTSPWKDLLAWLPYGVFHFAMPVIVVILIAAFAPRGTLPVFARTFGYMNIAGVITQLVFPCAPPWFEIRYGPLQPAAYSMPGDPGGLVRVDDLLGVEIYRNTFTASPLVFGAFPSLHSGCAWQLAFFTVFVLGPRALPVALAYVLWIWWSALYLRHHYVVDLVGGAIYAVIAFWIGSRFLPSLLPGRGMMAELQEEGCLDSSAACIVVLFDGCQDMGMAEKGTEDQKCSETSTDTLVLDNHDEGPKAAAAMVRPFRTRKSQQWNTWSGYEPWIEVLSLTTPSPESKNVLATTMPRTSTVCIRDIVSMAPSPTRSSSPASETLWHQLADGREDPSFTQMPSHVTQERAWLDPETSATTPPQLSTSPCKMPSVRFKRD
ncbi:unnamed protein product [Mortierella alpina]